MTDTSPPAGTRLSHHTPDLTRWTGEKASTFLKLLARSGKVAPCARAVGMSARSAYRLRQRAPTFAEYWDMAMAEAARRRASARRGRAVHPLLSKRPSEVAQRSAPSSAEPAAQAREDTSHLARQRVAV